MSTSPRYNPDPTESYRKVNRPFWTPVGWPRPALVDRVCPDDVTSEEFRALVLEALMAQPAESMSAFMLDLIVRHILDRATMRPHVTAEEALVDMLTTLEGSRHPLFSMFPTFWAQNYGEWNAETLKRAKNTLELLISLEAPLEGSVDNDDTSTSEE
jgi:hypothetical protein